jgi:hypothetical protein
MSDFIFYQHPVALNRERHRQLRLTVSSDHFLFAARTNAVPIASSEFAEVARDYPIVFVGGETGAINVAALVGLRQDENLMVDAQGRWAGGCYIPAFARRYPFILARTGADQPLTVCVDEVYKGLSNENGEPLFDEMGVETPLMKRVLDFLRSFHAESEQTMQFAQRLRELGLLVPKVIQIDRAGHKQTLQGLWIVDEARLRGIDDERVVELFRAGQLGWIHSHLLSLGSLARLVARLDQHSQIATTTPSGAAQTTPPTVKPAAIADDDPELPGSKRLQPPPTEPTRH